MHIILINQLTYQIMEFEGYKSNIFQPIKLWNLWGTIHVNFNQSNYGTSGVVSQLSPIQPIKL